ncbi:MAG TPA: peptide chain release factor N(5)-glutamine methyltransferase [Gammaproteobacteria bacterium]
MTVADALRSAAAQFTSDSARLDAELLLCHLLGVNRSWLYAWPDKALTPAQQQRFDVLVARRTAGEPVAHILGEREFWSLKLTVTPDTLIPRPDTELLVEQALRLLPEHTALRVADLGTGSGAIALAIARERPHCRVVATDRSEAALAVAQANAVCNQIGNVEFRQGRWCEALGDELFDLIVANPPYIAADDPHLAQGDVRFEPRAALVAGHDGLDDIRQIAHEARDHLHNRGWLLLEHGYLQGGWVAEILQKNGYENITTWRDLSGNERVTGGRVGG